MRGMTNISHLTSRTVSGSSIPSVETSADTSDTTGSVTTAGIRTS